MADIALAIDQGTTGTTRLVVDPALALPAAAMPSCHSTSDSRLGRARPEKIWSRLEQAAAAARIAARDFAAIEHHELARDHPCSGRLWRERRQQTVVVLDMGDDGLVDERASPPV